MISGIQGLSCGLFHITLSDLKKAIKANKAIVPDAEVKTHAGPDEHELGDDDEEASMTKEDQESDDDEEDLLQKEDQEQFSDDNQMNEVMDETGLEDDAEDMEPDKEEYYYKVYVLKPLLS